MYQNKQAAIDDITAAALVVRDIQVTEEDTHIEKCDMHCVFEHRDGHAQEVVQPIYVRRSDGATWYAKAESFLKDYLAIKQELSLPEYDGMDAAQAEDALRNKMVLKANPEFITWRMIQDVLGLARTVEVRGVLAAVAEADPQVKAVMDEVNTLLSPFQGLGVNPASQAFRDQVDVMRQVVVAAGQTFTEEEANKLKAIGEVPWSERHNVAIRSHQVAAIVG